MWTGRPRPSRQYQAHAQGARGSGQRLELSRIVWIYRVSDSDAHQNGTLTTPGAFKQLQGAAASFDDCRFRHFAVFTGGQTYIARRHHGGNGVLVDHLTDAVS